MTLLDLFTQYVAFVDFSFEAGVQGIHLFGQGSAMLGVGFEIAEQGQAVAEDVVIADARAAQGVQAVFHVATLHKPHVATHSRQDFVDTNVTGTLSPLRKT